MNRISSKLIWLAVLASGLVPGSVTLAQAAEFHVATHGADSNPGTKRAPFRTIQRAADLAQPGDTVTVHAGIYRERVSPPRGGTSDRQRIVYQAAPGEKVVITGAEPAKGWVKVTNDTWQVVIPNSFFGDFNPYNDFIRGDWFDGKGRKHHTGAVYLNGDWLTEAAKREAVMLPAGSNSLWFATVEAAHTTIWAQFPGVNPNSANVEINVRQTVFYPDQPGRNYITVRGFTLRQAATPWAPPTAEQIGLIGTHWSKGWIIENNAITHSTCSGIALGKHGDKFDNTSANSAEGYIKTIERAHAHSIPWTKENIGHHLVRNNSIAHCEQAGIVGSLGGSFSTITGNVIHDIHVRQLFTGDEQAGIKLHGAIDTTISRNQIYRTNRGIWLDWMAQGARVSANLLHDNNSEEDLFLEVNHGPCVVDHNIFLSPVNVRNVSEGSAFVHNLFAGKMVVQPDRGRATPFHPPHSTTVADVAVILGGDDRFYNNIFIGNGTAGAESAKAAPQQTPRGAGYGLWVYDQQAAPPKTGGNVFFHGARPYAQETNVLVLADRNPGVALIQRDGRFLLRADFGAEHAQAVTVPVTTALLGKAKISNAAFVNPDGSPLKLNTDYFGRKHAGKRPFAGPFAEGVLLGGKSASSPAGEYLLSLTDIQTNIHRKTTRLQVSPDGRYLQYADGTPFFYLADTAWMLPNKLTGEEAHRLFADRSAKGFTVIQSLIFRDLFVPNSANVHGVKPFASEADMYAAKLNPEWLDWVVRITKMAAEHGLVMAWLPTWGDKWSERNNSAGPVIFDEDSKAEAYGRELSDALGECDNVIWVLGGDSYIETPAQADIIRAMARGLRSGASRSRLITLHPGGGRTSAIFSNEDWLDINSVQSGHQRLNNPNYRIIEALYNTPPTKPCLDIEPNYEWMPVGIRRQNGIPPEHRAFFEDYDVRRSYYRSVLAGAAGFAYGCEPIRQIYRPGDRCHAWDGQGIQTWEEGLAAPGSSQLQLLKRLLLVRSYFTRMPDTGLLREIEGGENDNPVSHIAVARCSAGGYVLVYLPIRQMLAIDTSVLPAKRLRISEYDPEAGVQLRTWEIENSGIFRHIPSRRLDTLLVIDAIDLL